MLVGVMRLEPLAALLILPGAWSVSCAARRSFGLIVGVSCLWCSSAVPGVWSFLHAAQLMCVAARDKCPVYHHTIPSRHRARDLGSLTPYTCVGRHITPVASTAAAAVSSIDGLGGWLTSVTPQPETISGTLPLGRFIPIRPRRLYT